MGHAGILLHVHIQVGRYVVGATGTRLERAGVFCFILRVPLPMFWSWRLYMFASSILPPPYFCGIQWELRCICVSSRQRHG